jgi:hypothetical protein
MITVHFRSYGRGQREHSASFDLGSDRENGLAALSHAHRLNCGIVRVEDDDSPPDICGSCGSDLSTEEHDADCQFYSYGGEDGRDG